VSKIFWSILILVLFAVGFWNIDLTVNDFYNYDVITNIKRSTPDVATFPAITVCSDAVLRKEWHIDGVSNKSEDVYLEEKVYDDFLWVAEFRTYNPKISGWNVTDVKDKLEFFGFPAPFQCQFCLRFNSVTNNKTRQLITANSTKDHFLLSFGKQIVINSSYDASLQANEYYTLSFLDRRVIFYVYIADNSLDSFKKIEPIELGM
jgi:hypothetical protein